MYCIGKTYCKVCLLGLLLLVTSPLIAQSGAPDTQLEFDRAVLSREIAIQERYQEELLSRPGVAGVGLTLQGSKPALLVLIAKDQKRPVLPEELDGLPVVVEEGFEASLITGGTGCIPCHADKKTMPVDMGNSTSSLLACDAGTLGFKACDPETHTIGYVTAWHVATRGASLCPGVAANGTSQLHRGKADAPTCASEDVIGTLVRSASIRPYPLPNYADASFVASTDSQTSRSIRDIGLPTETGPDALNSCVRKSGRTTGLTWGRIDAINLSLTVDAGCSTNLVFFPVFRIKPDSTCASCTNPPCDWFAIGGDSGSAVMSPGVPRKLIGMVFAKEPIAGGKVAGLATPIGFVLGALNLTLDFNTYCP